MHVPLVAQAAVLPPLDCVLVDDDAMVRIVWAGAAQRNGKHMARFSDPTSVLRATAGFSIDTEFYIDSNLGQTRGEDLAKNLYDRGFTRLHLCTGYEPESFEDMPWLISIRGKEPPFTPSGLPPE